MNVLKAGAEVVNFRSMSSSIYENLFKLCAEISEQFVILYLFQFQKTFIERFAKIIDLADSSEI